MTQAKSKRLPAELAQYTLMSEWDRAEAEEKRRQRALDELARAVGRGR